MSVTQFKTTVAPIDGGTHHQPPPSSPPIPTIAASSAPSLPGAGAGEHGLHGIPSLEGGGTGGSAVPRGASSMGESSLVGAGDGTTKGLTADIKNTKPKAGLHVSVSQSLAHCAG